MDEIKNRYEELIREKITPDFSHIDVTIPNLEGQHFCSSCDHITIHIQKDQTDGSEKEEEIHLFSKRMLQNQEYAQTLKNLKIFEKEAGFYNEVVPALYKIVKDRAKPGVEYEFDVLPKCYFATGDLVILENLAKRGYFLLEEIQRQDLEAARLYMKTLAKFNAPSYILLKEEKNLQDFFQKYPFMVETMRKRKEGEKGMNMWLKSFLKSAEKMIETVSSEEASYALKTIREFQTDVQERMLQPLRLDDENELDLKNKLVIGHADTCNNNMMFRRDPETQELAHNILCDFQLVRVATPSIDLASYFFSTLKHEVRKTEWLHLLRFYYDRLRENVESLNSQLDFSFEELVQDYKKRVEHGFIWGVGLTAFANASSTIGNLEEEENVMDKVGGSVDNWIEKGSKNVKKCGIEIIGMFQEFKELKGE